MKEIKLVIVLVFSLLFMNNCKDKNTIEPEPSYFLEGYVYDNESSLAIDSAYINFNGHSTYSNESGYFKISNINVSFDTLYITHIGYEEGTFALELPMIDSVLNISLQIKYIDFLYLDYGTKTYSYSAGSSSCIFSGDGFSTKGKAFWNLFEINKRNDSTFYKIEETRYDTVWIRSVNSTHYETNTIIFEIIEDNKGNVSIPRFFKGNFKRYYRSDFYSWLSFSIDSYGYIEIEKEYGITQIGKSYFDGCNSSAWSYHLIK